LEYAKENKELQFLRFSRNSKIEFNDELLSLIKDVLAVEGSKLNYIDFRKYDGVEVPKNYTDYSDELKEKENKKSLLL